MRCQCKYIAGIDRFLGSRVISHAWNDPWKLLTSHRERTYNNEKAWPQLDGSLSTFYERWEDCCSFLCLMCYRNLPCYILLKLRFCFGSTVKGSLLLLLRISVISIINHSDFETCCLDWQQYLDQDITPDLCA